jgi:integrase/recombinase XerC
LYDGELFLSLALQNQNLLFQLSMQELSRSAQSPVASAPMMTDEQLLAYYKETLNKESNYVRLARLYLDFCLDKGFGFDEMSWQLFCAGKSKSYHSTVRRFVKFCQKNNIFQVSKAPKHRHRAASNELVLKFLKHCEATMDGEKSPETYNIALTQYFKFLDKTHQVIGRSSVLAFMQDMQQKGLSAYTQNSYLSAIRQLVRFVISERQELQLGLTDAQLQGLREILLIRARRIPRGFTKDSLNEEQLEKLLKNVEDCNRLHFGGSLNEAELKRQTLHDRLMISLMAHCGLRTIEVCRLRKRDCDIEQGLLHVIGKGYKATVPVKCFMQTRELLRMWLPNVDNSLFNGIETRQVREVVNRHLQYCNFKTERMTAHSLRHTCAEILRSKGVSDRLIQRQLRHARADTTQLYTLRQEEKIYLERMPEMF